MTDGRVLGRGGYKSLWFRAAILFPNQWER